MTTLRRERRQKFAEIIRKAVYDYYKAYMDESEVQRIAAELSDAAESRTEKLTPAEVPDNYPLEWYIQHGLPIPPHLIDQNQMAANAVNEFESKLGFSSLPWDSTAEWQKFKKWVIATYSGRLTAWEDYSDWRKAKGKYDAMSNKQIRMNPSVFMDTGWPSFLASSAMYDDGEKLRLL